MESRVIFRSIGHCYLRLKLQILILLFFGCCFQIFFGWLYIYVIPVCVRRFRMKLFVTIVFFAVTWFINLKYILIIYMYTGVFVCAD